VPVLVSEDVIDFGTEPAFSFDQLKDYYNKIGDSHVGSFHDSVGHKWYLYKSLHQKIQNREVLKNELHKVKNIDADNGNTQNSNSNLNLNMNGKIKLIKYKWTKNDGALVIKS